MYTSLGMISNQRWFKAHHFIESLERPQILCPWWVLEQIPCWSWGNWVYGLKLGQWGAIVFYKHLTCPFPNPGVEKKAKTWAETTHVMFSWRWNLRGGFLIHITPIEAFSNSFSTSRLIIPKRGFWGCFQISYWECTVNHFVLLYS